MAVPYTFGSATASIPLSQLDSNFATTITLGNVAVQLGNTVTSLTGVTNVASATSLTLGSNGNTTAVTIDASQNVGVGITPSAWGVKALQMTGSISAIVGDTRQYYGCNYYVNASIATKYITSNYALNYVQDATAGTHAWYNAPSGTAGNTATFTQAMTLDASGNLLVGQTSSGLVNSNSLSIQPAGNGATIGFNHASGTSSGNSFAYFAYNAGSIGSITQNGTTSVNFNGYIVNPSDQKLKTNIVDAPSSLLLIDKIKIRSFDWIAEEKNQSYGVIAQELETVFPEAVNSPISEDGFYGVDYTKLVPMLVKAIQEQQALITQLQADVAALKGA